MKLFNLENLKILKSLRFYNSNISNGNMNLLFNFAEDIFWKKKYVLFFFMIYWMKSVFTSLQYIPFQPQERELLRRHSLLSMQGRTSSLEMTGSDHLTPHQLGSHHHHHLANVPARFRWMDPNRPTFEALLDKVS